ncbi:hypothetical protein GCM10010387_36560 [Streptomyces inusitatus]|uniref:Uncharacterized protein n=1 Tax=Streptomyces inusitatus TaxID=68221 RepID=A0A918UWC7_9ACTN|nr:hypothetical protein [Streptomyces inusitatus]GGZ39151.1 hypothetical protein GCM10010387_36560 [Streptomyces inusitatus]
MSIAKGYLIVEGPGTEHQMSSSAGCTVLAVRTRPAGARTPRKPTRRDRPPFRAGSARPRSTPV